MSLRYRHPTRGEIWVEGHSMPIHEPDNNILWHGYLQDVTERKQTENALQASLQEKETLLREVHHRVKNNLAAISSLLDLQQDGVMDAATAARLAELGARIRSMALVHEMLCQSENLSRVDLHDYLQTLIDRLRGFFDPYGVVQVRVAAAGVWMDLDTAIPCGLIVNELVINALKYAFPDHKPLSGTTTCEVTVSAAWDGASYTVSSPDIGSVTASFGVAGYRRNETVDQWLKRVDELVYQVKREGRDRVSQRP